ncbi:hypothetical protein [Flavobacterium luteolum]|uniref:hypothetical protein n=1 Tax=Flavobacterium luteolum TaxID=3003259 RepID=UPI00248D774C|nr:hypothetical protein [Flavobacterium luteolum]
MFIFFVRKSGEGFTGTGMPENDIFYFHPDHSGSTSYIATKYGFISQPRSPKSSNEMLCECLLTSHWQSESKITYVY